MAAVEGYSPQHDTSFCMRQQDFDHTDVGAQISYALIIKRNMHRNQMNSPEGVNFEVGRGVHLLLNAVQFIGNVNISKRTCNAEAHWMGAIIYVVKRSVISIFFIRESRMP